MTLQAHDTNTRAHRQAAAVMEARAGRMEQLGPPMLSGVLPATVELPPQVKLGTLAVIAFALSLLALGWMLHSAWTEGLLDRAEGETTGEYLDHLLDVVLTQGLLAPVLGLVVAGVLRWTQRHAQDSLRITLSLEEARVEDGSRAWSVPVASFTAVTLRHRKGHSSSLEWDSIGQSRGRISGQGYQRVRQTLWWVELVHPDPMRSVPVWASKTPTAEAVGRRVAASLADRLGLPLMLPEAEPGT